MGLDRQGEWNLVVVSNAGDERPAGAVMPSMPPEQDLRIEMESFILANPVLGQLCKGMERPQKRRRKVGHTRMSVQSQKGEF